jgi:CheY-like chemotaxis protein
LLSDVFASEQTDLVGRRTVNVMNQANHVLVSVQSRQSGRQLRVLVVDDSPVERLQIAELLEGWGLVADMACDGAEAVELAKQTQFDLVLMDLAMPVLDGMDATRQIREYESRDPSRRAVPIVAHTSYEVAAQAEFLGHIGMSGLLQKPASPYTLDTCLNHWCPRAVLMW